MQEAILDFCIYQIKHLMLMDHNIKSTYCVHCQLLILNPHET